MFNVKSQDDYNALKWDDKLRYNAQNKGNQYAKNEETRTQQVLYTKPTEAAGNWWAQQQYVKNGGNAEDAILGNFDKSAYQWQAGTPVRQTMQTYGLKNENIGWDGKNVTYNGKSFMTPDVVADGTSYATEDAIKKAYTDYVTDNDIVAARSYINNKNPNVNVGWDGATGQVLVGSQRLTPDYITPDGVAQVSRAKVDAALKAEAETTGEYSYKDLYDENRNRYDALEQKILDSVTEPEEFTYNPETDPLYQDFKKQWLKQSQAQYDDTIARANTQSGGAPSLGALSAAWNMYQDSIGQLDAYKQQFRDAAYQRWEDDYARANNTLETIAYMADRDLQNQYMVNQYVNTERDNALAREYQQLTNQQLKDSLELNQALAPYQIKQAIQAYDLGQLQLEEQGLINLARQAELYGLTFKDGQRTGGSDLDDGGPLNVTKSASYNNAVTQISNIINEPGRQKGLAVEQALRWLELQNQSGDLSDAEYADILEDESLFGVTGEQLTSIMKRVGIL